MKVEPACGEGRVTGREERTSVATRLVPWAASYNPTFHGATFHGEVMTAPRYRIFSIGDVHPGMFEVAESGISVPGELYELPDEVWARVEAGEPPSLYRGPVEPADGRSVPGILFPREMAEGIHREFTEFGGWREYWASPNVGPDSPLLPAPSAAPGVAPESTIPAGRGAGTCHGRRQPLARQESVTQGQHRCGNQ